MKTKQIITGISLFLLLAVVCLTACKKEAGPKGDQGEPGLEGPAGSTVLSGKGVPAISLGNIGDFYLDLNTSKFYGPKKQSDWGGGFSMLGANGMNGANGTTGATGATGAAGASGSKILSGNGTPAANIGVVGDYFLDKVSYSLYGPKLTTGWGVGLSLKGPAGTSNISYSGWSYAVKFRDTIIDNSALNIADLIAPVISQDILNSGTVQVYMKFGDAVFPLPYISYAGGRQNIISYAPRLKRFIITRFTADNSNLIKLSTLLQYRYVIIPGGTKLSSLRPADLKDYELIKRRFNIPD